MNNVQKIVEALLGEGGFAIEPGGAGLRRIGPEKVTLKVGEDYFMGASSSPTWITITGLTPEWIVYTNHDSGSSGLKIERWIGADLIAKGVHTWLASGYPKHQPERATKLRSLLR